MGSPMLREATEKDSGMIFSPSLFIPHPADRTGGHEAGQDGGTTRRRFFRLPERPPGQDYLVFLILRINEPVEVAGLIRTVSVIILRGLLIVCGLRGCGRITRWRCWGRTSGHAASRRPGGTDRSSGACRRL